MEYKTSSVTETHHLAEKLAHSGKRIFALSGDMGSGKTTFTQGFAKALGIQDKIISPTFVLVRQHPIPGTKKVLYHIDLYRIDDPTSYKELGLQEIIDNPENVVLIEWAEKAPNLIPSDAVNIHFETLDETTRKITIAPEAS